MTEAERIEEWVRHFKVCHLKVNALCAVLENDGEQILLKVLKKLGMESTLELIKAEKKR